MGQLVSYNNLYYNRDLLCLTSTGQAALESGRGVPAPTTVRPTMDAIESEASEPCNGSGVTDGGEQPVDWEGVARRLISDDIDRFAEQEVAPQTRSLVRSVSSGENIVEEFFDLIAIQQEFIEYVEHHLTFNTEDLSYDDPAMNLFSNGSRVRSQFATLSRAIVDDDLADADIERARQVLEEAEQSLDDLEELQEAIDDE